MLTRLHKKANNSIWPAILFLSSVALSLLAVDFFDLWQFSRKKYARISKTTAFNPECEPVKNILFIKTFKCASSAIQNLFFRYGENNNLSFGYHNLINAYNHLARDANFFTLTNVKTFRENLSDVNIIAMHGRPNLTELRRTLPEGTKIISIIREPLKMFQSMYYYAQFDLKYKMNLEQFIQSGQNLTVLNATERDLFTLKNFKENSTEVKQLLKYTWNPMLYYHGISYKQMINATEDQLLQIFRDLDNFVDLVLIVDRIDESLVLLRRMLCLEWKDMVIFHKNQGTRQPRDYSASSHLRNLYNNWSSADFAFYNYFLQKFEEKIAKIDDKVLKAEVNKIVYHRNAMMSYCKSVFSGPDKNKTLEKPPADLVSIWNRDTCSQLRNPELNYISRLQTKRLKK